MPFCVAKKRTIANACPDVFKILWQKAVVDKMSGECLRRGGEEVEEVMEGWHRSAEVLYSQSIEERMECPNLADCLR